MEKRFTLLTAVAALLAMPATVNGKNLQINSNEYAVDTLVYKHKIGPGVQYARYRVPGRPLDIYVLETDITNPYITLEVWNGMNKAVAGEQPSHRFNEENRPGHDCVAAHNGDFYTTANGEAGMSRMGLIGANEVIFNPTGNALFVLSEDLTPVCGAVNFQGKLSRKADNSSARIHTVNQLRLEWEPATAANQLSLFTAAFGTNLHSASSGGKVAIIAPVSGSAVYPVNTPLQFKVVSVADNPGGQAIPADGAVLYGVGTSADYLAGLNPDDEIEIYLGASMPDYPAITRMREAVGGSNHIILRNGQLCNLNNPDLHPRTFMGISQDKKTVYSVVVDGRSRSSAGIDLDDQGRVLQWLGAWDGLNLDGGGSSSMVVDGKPVNRTSDGAERAVGNGVLFYSTAPVDDDIAEIGFEPRCYNVPVHSNFRPSIYGYNKYGLLKTRNLEGVTLTCDPELGRIDEEGMFVANATPGHGYIYATFNGITAKQEVMTQASKAELVYTEYIVDHQKGYPIRMQAAAGGHSYSVDPSCMEWSTPDTDVASVSNGRIQALKEGTATLTGKGADFEGTVTAHCEIPYTPTRSMFEGLSADQLELKQSGGRNIKATLENDALTVTYQGNGSARGAYISVGPKGSKYKTYALPYKLELDVNPGDITVTGITASYATQHGGKGTLNVQREELPKNQTTTITIDLKDVMDVADNSAYPLTLTSLRFNLGASASGKDFTLSVPRFEQFYNNVAGVESIGSDNAAADGPATYFDLQGRPVKGNAEGSIVIERRGSKARKVLNR